MSIGTLASGVLAYAFNVLAARALGPASYGAVGALWGGMFLLAVLLFRPVEQTVSRAVADHLARGESATRVIRSAAWLTAIIATAAIAGCALAAVAAFGAWRIVRRRGLRAP
jgi:O-antigen/teichoic acid export membrane protein